MALLSMTDVALQGKRVLIREDLNVPINEQGEIADDTRIRSSLDTLRYAIEAGARVMVMSHLGRPVEGHWDAKFSLSVVADRVGTLLSRKIPLIRDWTTAQGAAQLHALQDAQIVLLENVRFNVGEAEGLLIGQSLYDATLVEEARNLMRLAKSAGKPILLPEDFTVAEQISAEAQTKVCARDQIGSGDYIVDLGPQTIAQYEQILMSAQTIIWNGPVGIVEYPAFSLGTRCLANAIAQSDAYSLIGGGDTIAAINRMGLESEMSYISTGGGALLEFLEGKSLPAIQIIEERNAGLLGSAS